MKQPTKNDKTALELQFNHNYLLVKCENADRTARQINVTEMDNKTMQRKTIALQNYLLKAQIAATILDNWLNNRS